MPDPKKIETDFRHHSNPSDQSTTPKTMNPEQINKYVTHECNSCYETKPCTVEEEDLKDGEEYYYCDECRAFWEEDAKAE